jgi:hypothetical protein
MDRLAVVEDGDEMRYENRHSPGRRRMGSPPDDRFVHLAFGTPIAPILPLGLLLLLGWAIQPSRFDPIDKVYKLIYPGRWVDGAWG